MTLPLPNFSADLAGIVYPPPTLTPMGIDGSGAFGFRLNSETGGIYAIDQSADLVNWTTMISVTNVTGTMNVSNLPVKSSARMFFRARRSQ